MKGLIPKMYRVKRGDKELSVTLEVKETLESINSGTYYFQQDYIAAWFKANRQTERGEQ